MSFHSPFDQPSYGGKAAAKKAKPKRAKAKAKPKRRRPKPKRKRKPVARKPAPSKPYRMATADELPHEVTSSGWAIYLSEWGEPSSIWKWQSKRPSYAAERPHYWTAIHVNGKRLDCQGVRLEDGTPSSGATSMDAWYTALKAVGSKNNPPATKAKKKKRQHVKDKEFEALKKRVAPALKAAEKLLTKRNADRMQAIADGILERATSKWGAGDKMFVQSARLYYVPLVKNLQAGFAEAKRAAAVMRAVATKQGAYNQAKATYLGAAWSVAENMLRASDLLANRVGGPFPKESEAFGDAWFKLTQAIKPSGLAAANPGGLNRRARAGDLLARERFLAKIRAA